MEFDTIIIFASCIDLIASMVKIIHEEHVMSIILEDPFSVIVNFFANAFSREVSREPTTNGLFSSFIIIKEEEEGEVDGGTNRDGDKFRILNRDEGGDVSISHSEEHTLNEILITNIEDVIQHEEEVIFFLIFFVHMITEVNIILIQSFWVDKDIFREFFESV